MYLRILLCPYKNKKTVDSHRKAVDSHILKNIKISKISKKYSRLEGWRVGVRPDFLDIFDILIFGHPSNPPSLQPSKISKYQKYKKMQPVGGLEG